MQCSQALSLHGPTRSAHETSGRTGELGWHCAQADDVLSKAGEPFTFEGLAKAHGARLSVAAVSAKEGDVEPVQQFIFTSAL